MHLQRSQFMFNLGRGQFQGLVCDATELEFGLAGKASRKYASGARKWDHLL